MRYCRPYGKPDEWEEDLVQDAKECKRKLLNEVLGNITQNNQKESVLYGEINDPDGYTNVREGKSSKSEIVFKVYEGDKFEIINNRDENWWLVEYNGKQGYIYSDRIDIIK